MQKFLTSNKQINNSPIVDEYTRADVNAKKKVNNKVLLKYAVVIRMSLPCSTSV